MSNFDFGNKLCNENKCEVDEKLHVCPNCLRTQEEIDYWEEYSEIDKKMILKTIERRRKILETVSENEIPDLRWVF